MTTDQLLRRVRTLLTDIGCQSSGCYAATGHQPVCHRGRGEKLVIEIDRHLAQKQLGLRA